MTSTRPAGSCLTSMIRPRFSHVRTSRCFLPVSNGTKSGRFLTWSLSKGWFGTARTGCFTTAERTSTWGSQQHLCVECLAQALARRVPLQSQTAAARFPHFRVMHRHQRDAQATVFRNLIKPYDERLWAFEPGQIRNRLHEHFLHGVLGVLTL